MNAYQKPAGSDWTQNSPVHLWSFSPPFKNYLGWHLYSTSEGIRSLRELLGLLACSETTASRTVQILPPTEDMLHRPIRELKDTELLSPSSLKIIFSPSATQRCKDEIVLQGNNASLEISPSGANCLRKALERWENHEWDFSISLTEKESSRIWFW